MKDWSPTQYLKFADERTRAARDLLAQVPLASPSRVYDLGCGPGNSMALLAERWPAATITGIDNSPAMLAEARQALPDVGFENADLASWVPAEPCELLFSNATLQWVPDHMAVLARLAQSLKPGGVLAAQMPDNLGEPSHLLMAETAENGPWAEKLAGAARPPMPSPQVYYDRLKPRFARLDIWHTIYNHPLDGAGGIVAWVKSTGLRPFLDRLGEDERHTFLADYRRRIEAAYPPSTDGKILLRFPRLFIVGVR